MYIIIERARKSCNLPGGSEGMFYTSRPQRAKLTQRMGQCLALISDVV